MVSNAQALTRQFYEWERLGRGWHKEGVPVALEPSFIPFFGHYVEQEIIDDGKRDTWLSSLANMFDEQRTAVTPQEREQFSPAFPDNDTAGLSLYWIILPRHFKQQSERIEQLLIMLSYRKSPISFEIIASAEEITLQLACKEYDAGFICTQLHAYFPDCTVIEADEDKLITAFDSGLPLHTVDYGLEEEFMRPMAQLQSDFDPYTPLFGILSRLETDEYTIIQILFSGTHNAWAESIMTAVSDDYGKQSFFLDAPEMPQLAKEKTARPLFGVAVRAIAFSGTPLDAALLLQHIATAIVHASISPNNSLIPLSDAAYTIEERIYDMALRRTHRVGMLLNSRELATFVHFPAIQNAKLHADNRTTKAVSDTLIGDEYILGINEHRSVEQYVSIPIQQRLRHIHIIGATGTGKSTLLKSLIMQDIGAGQGLMCLDPHGDLIDDILQHIPIERINDVVLIDPHDAEFPIALNILTAHSDVEKELLASDLVALFRRFSTSWGDSMNSVFANAILAFMYNAQQYHLGDLKRFLIEPGYRAQILSTVTDPEITYYWQHEFPILKGGSIGSILTRLDAFLRPRVIRNMICQKQSLDFAQLMDSQKIVLVKLSEGLLGTENSYLLGAFIVSKLQQIAMSRQAQVAKDRIPFFCYIDEFQHFITPSMASILSGARKYGLGLIVSHQDMQQVLKYDAEIASSVLANAGTRICFRLGDTDAKRMEGGFSGFTATDLQNLTVGEAIARVNTTDNDFNLDVIPYMSDSEENYIEAIIDQSRKKYSVPIQSPFHQPTTSSEVIVDDTTTPPRPKEVVIPPEEAEPSEKQERVREHRYCQMFVKTMAEAHGYKASIEMPTPDGNGQVDVLLEKGNETIAVEISHTTGAEWELHNIKKCLDAGYTRIVVVCTQTGAKMKAIEHQILAQLSTDQQKKIQVIGRNDIQSIFETTTHSAPTDTVIKGYRVKVNYESNANRQDLLKSIINAGKK